MRPLKVRIKCPTIIQKIPFEMEAFNLRKLQSIHIPGWGMDCSDLLPLLNVVVIGIALALAIAVGNRNR